MTREGRQINAAGGFLRALKQPERPGGQALGGTPLPVKETLLLLSERPRLSSEIAAALTISETDAARTLENLRGLGLVDVQSTGEGDRAALTDLGSQVAQQRRGG